MITLNQPYSFTGIGRKNNQEDYLAPAEMTDASRVFVLCDGMGGHERGEVASSTVANSLCSTLSAASARGSVTREIFESALTAAYDALELVESADSERKPGTTLACLAINNNSVLAAHIGDSRIYQIRPSKVEPQNPTAGIIYRSEDHSLVNDLVKAGQITAEQARTHPRRNVITRAMQPRLERRFPATIRTSANVKTGDYFFLCSDGVLEQLTDETLCNILASPSLTDSEKMDAIKAECNRGTRDNFTACLVPIGEASIARATKEAPPYRWPIFILIAICIITAMGIVSFYAGWFSSKTPESTVIIDSSDVEVDTLLVDTIVIQEFTDSVASAALTDTVTPLPAPSTKDTAVTKPQAADTIKKKPHTPAAETHEHKPAEQSAIATEPEHETSVKPDNEVPPRRKSTPPGQVPERKKQPSEPKPLA